MNREIHVRICESLGVKLPRATRPFSLSLQTKGPTPGQEVGPSASTTYRKWCPRRESNPCYGLERAVT